MVIPVVVQEYVCAGSTLSSTVRTSTYYPIVDEFFIAISALQELEVPKHVATKCTL